MSIRKTLIVAGITAVAVPLIKILWNQAQGQTAKPKDVAANEPTIAPLIKETLEKHHGEEMPFVQAFEEALEQEAQHEKELANSSGLRH